jgi:hypothetical protein
MKANKIKMKCKCGQERYILYTYKKEPEIEDSVNWDLITFNNTLYCEKCIKKYIPNQEQVLTKWRIYRSSRDDNSIEAIEYRVFLEKVILDMFKRGVKTNGK